MRRIRQLVVAMFVVVLAVAQPAVAGAVPPYTLEERAAAIASPSLVFIDVGYRGYLRLRDSEVLVNDEPIIVHTRCSGFVVSAGGHAVAPTHCLQPSQSSMRSIAASIVANARIDEGDLDSELRDAFLNDVRRTAEFTGEEPDDPPALYSVTAQLFIATTELDRATVVEGRVVEALPIDNGDLALIKLDAAELPVARLLSTTPNRGQQVVQVAFTVANPERPGPDYVVRSRSGIVTSRYESDGPARYQIDGDLGTGSSGGMAVDGSGNVIGMITSVSGRGNTILVGADQIGVLLANAGVDNTLTPIDETYRAGLDAYFGGRYSEAIAALDTVLAEQTDNLPAQTYRTFASERRAVEGDPRSGLGLWPLIVGVTIVLVLGIVILLVRGLRLRARAREFDEFGEMPPYPAMLPAAPTPRAIESGPASAAPGSGGPVSPAPASGGPVSGAPDASWAPGWAAPGWTPPPPRPDAVAGPSAGPTAVSAPVPTAAAGQAPTPPEQPAAWPAVTVWRSPNDGGPPVPPPGPAPSSVDPITGQSPAGDNGRPPAQQ